MEQNNIISDQEENASVHRDLSWLSFNARVLQEAKDKRNPLLERIKFLGIYSKNLGEFFHVRMAYHLNLIRINKSTRKKLDYSPKQLIKKITQIVNQQQLDFTRIINDEIRPELAENNINLKNLSSISDTQRSFIHDYFNDTLRLHVDPVLMRGKSINPFLKDGSLYLGILLQDNTLAHNNQEYGLVRIPSDVLPRFIILPSIGADHDIILLDDILRHGLAILFPGFDIQESYSFKMTRDAELYIEGNFSGTIKEAIKKSLAKRQVGTPARFVYDRNMPKSLIEFLTDSFDLNKYDKIKEGRYQNYFDFINFPSFGKLELLNEPLIAIKYNPIEEATSVFDAIRSSDHFIHPPYHTFESVIKFFEEASIDACVTDIYITQYRIGDESRILKALIEGAKNGKHITVFVEVQARFDEQSNLEWGEKLEQAGINVIYSIPGVKVHCKIGLVKRIENNKEKEYAILSTGNFHEGNSKIYSDMCLFTSDSSICKEVNDIFQYLELKPNQLPQFNHMLVGKSNLRERLEALIDKEIENVKNGKKGYVLIKLNSLEDSRMIDKLYQASKANVKVDLIIRGICCLIPGLPNISENINIISILDRYLEHARVYYFYSDGEEKLYLSSADWMTRNLSRRIEAAFPIYDISIKQQVIEILKLQLVDNVKARIIDQNLSNKYKKDTEPLIQSQNSIYEIIREVSDLRCSTIQN